MLVWYVMVVAGHGTRKAMGFDPLHPGAGARRVPFPRSSNATVPSPVNGVAIGRYLVRMRSVGIKVLNSKLSEYVRLAASGETILVTDRDTRS